MIRCRSKGRPCGGRAKFRRELLDALPESLPKGRLANALNVNIESVTNWVIRGLPYRIGESRAKGVVAHLIDRDRLIDWLRRTGRVYAEEWPDA